MRNTRRRPLRAVAAAVTLLCAAAVPAAAHPHMCVSIEATVLNEKGAFTGLQQKWTFFDERSTAMAVEGADKDSDGKLDRAELEELATLVIQDLKDADYFTFPAVAGQPVKFGEPKEYRAEYTAGLLSLSFTLPLATPVPAGDKALELAFHDKENMIAFGLPKAPNPFRLGNGAPKGCRVAVQSLEGEELAALSMILDALGCPITVPRAISVACDGS
jgi:ABC-type uncharacterized transport system substrate-binding protein